MARILPLLTGSTVHRRWLETVYRADRRASCLKNFLSTLIWSTKFLKSTSPLSGFRSAFVLVNASFGPTSANGTFGGLSRLVERFDSGLAPARSFLLPAGAFALGVMENDKSSPERDSSPTLPNDESTTDTDLRVGEGIVWITVREWDIWWAEPVSGAV